MSQDKKIIQQFQEMDGDAGSIDDRIIDQGAVDDQLIEINADAGIDEHFQMTGCIEMDPHQAPFGSIGQAGLITATIGSNQRAVEGDGVEPGPSQGINRHQNYAVGVGPNDAAAAAVIGQEPNPHGGNGGVQGAAGGGTAEGAGAVGALGQAEAADAEIWNAIPPPVMQNIRDFIVHHYADFANSVANLQTNTIVIRRIVNDIVRVNFPQVNFTPAALIMLQVFAADYAKRAFRIYNPETGFAHAANQVQVQAELDNDDEEEEDEN